MKTPWHVWVIGVLMLVWFGMGALDYTMSHLRSAAYIAMIPEAVRADMLAYLDGYPIWATSAWATGVWFAVLGALLLLARSRFAVPALILSMIGFLANCTYTFVIGPQLASLTGTGSKLFTLAIFVSLLAAIFYVRRQDSNGVLS